MQRRFRIEKKMKQNTCSGDLGSKYKWACREREEEEKATHVECVDRIHTENE